MARALGDYEEAKQHYQASYAIRENFDDPEGLAVAVNHLGRVALLQADFAEAKKLFEQSLATYRKLNDQGGLANSLNGLGLANCGLNNLGAAQRHFHEALQIATEINFVPLMLNILIGIAELWLITGYASAGVELLVMVARHPSSDRETKERADRSLDKYRANLPAPALAEAKQRGRQLTLEATANATLLELETLIITAAQHTSTAGQAAVTAQATAAAALVEPLTPRELEVLHLIAEGLTNQQIAEELIISVGTVKSYTNQIYGKLGVNSRTQAVARARAVGILA